MLSQSMSDEDVGDGGIVSGHESATSDDDDDYRMLLANVVSDHTN